MPVEFRQQTELQRRWSTISAIVDSIPTPPPHDPKTPLREARPCHLVQRASVRLPSVGSYRATNRLMSMTTMVLSANHRRVGSDTSSSAAATAQDRRPVLCHGRQLALRLVPVELQTSAALHALASTTVRTSARCCRRRLQQRSDASSPVPARLRPRKPHQQPNPIHNLRLFLQHLSPHQRLLRHPNNQQRRQRRLTTVTMTA